MEFQKYGKIKIVGHEDNEGIFSDPTDEIVIEEKMDGANLRVAIRNGKIIFGSRNQQLISDEGEDTNIQKNFLRAVNFIRKQISESEGWNTIQEYEKYILFGENMVSHTMSYDWDIIPPFLGFDIYDVEDGKYLDVDEAKVLFENLGLPFVPIIWKGKIKDINKFLEGCKNEK